MTYEELIALLKSAEDYRAIDERREEIAELIPAVSVEFDYDQNNKYHQYDLWEHSVRVTAGLERNLPDDILYLAALLHDIGKPASMVHGDDPSDNYSHFPGHGKKGALIVSNEVIPKLEMDGIHHFNGEEKKRLLLYVEHHDDRIPDEEKKLERNIKACGYDLYVGLIKLEISDANEHIDLPPIREKKERLGRALALAINKKEVYSIEK